MTQRRVNIGDVLASVIIPAYKEGDNVRPLVTKLFNVLDERKSGVVNRQNIEVIYVDDNSGDKTESEINALAADGYPVRLIIRKNERGLSSAVTRGFDEANGKLLLCMDADLQHPPEKVPEMFEALSKNGVQFVIGTRYAPGVSIDKDWPLHRRIISNGARFLALGLTPLSDPMTGFFGIQKDIYLRGRGKVNNVGFKIALELYVKCNVRTPAEVPFSFGVRLAGESKLSSKVIVKYLEQLVQLYNYRYPGLLLAILLLIVMVIILIIKLSL